MCIMQQVPCNQHMQCYLSLLGEIHWSYAHGCGGYIIWQPNLSSTSGHSISQDCTAQMESRVLHMHIAGPYINISIMSSSNSSQHLMAAAPSHSSTTYTGSTLTPVCSTTSSHSIFSDNQAVYIKAWSRAAVVRSSLCQATLQV